MFLAFLRLECFLDDHVPALFHRDHSLHWLVAGQGDVDDIVARVEQEFNRRGLLEHAAIDGDLRALGRGLHAHLAHARLRTVSAKYFLELADSFDVVDIAQRTKRGREVVILPWLTSR